MAGIRTLRRWALATLTLWIMSAAASAQPDSDTAPQADESYSLHGVITFVDQYHPAFTSPYRGPNSLDPGSRGMETIAATFAAGLKLWDGGQFYVDPEIDQGFGLSNTFGVAAFPSGDAYKVGAATPYFRLQRIFLRQVVDLGGDTQSVAPDFNQLGTHQTADNIIITAGKFSAVDVFDTNAYAHDPTSDFLSWAIIDSGAFDYAADAWGYSYGASVEWTQSWWTLRSGLFALSRIPNNTELQTDFAQFELVEEAEARYDLFGLAGKVKVLGFLNRARMGTYLDALKLAEATDTTPNTALVRKYNSRPGFALNIEQPLTKDLGAFVRASFANGDFETYEFIDTDQSFAAGLSLKGSRWGRDNDTVGVAAVIDGASATARRYYAAGGLGIVIGDGKLPQYATEDVVEAYYNVQVASWLATDFDYQFVLNPAYNPQRGPVSILAVRIHAAF